MQPRRPVTVVFLMLAIALACIGCSGGGANTPNATSVAEQKPQPTAVVVRSAAPPDTLRWSLEGTNDIPSLDPARTDNAAAVAVASLVFNGLVGLGEGLEVKPANASEWKVSADGRVYTFTIREGLTFANGDPVTADDFAYSLNRALSPEINSYGAPQRFSVIDGADEVTNGESTSASGVRAINPRTLEIRLKSPLAYFLAQLTYPATYVVPKALGVNSTTWPDAIYGTGPYRVAEWQRGNSILLTANERYWQGKPGIPNIRMVFSTDSQTAYQRYLAGELDLMGSLQNPLPAALLPEVQGLPDFKSSPSLNTRYIGFNHTLPPFNNDNVRRAFALAVNKRGLATAVLNNNVIAADRILPQGMLGTQQAITPLTFNPEQAREELAKAGFPEGKGLPPIKITYSPEGGENDIVVQAIQQDWEQNLGIKVELAPLELDAFNEALKQTRLNPAQGIQMYYSIWGADYPDPQNFLSLQLTTDSEFNNGHFDDPRFNQLVAEADTIGDRTQIQRRILLYNQAEQIAINRVGWLPILYLKFNVLMHPRVEGIDVTANGYLIPDWTKARLNPDWQTKQ